MTFWWLDFGRFALVGGVLGGLVLAAFMTWQRWNARQRGKISQAHLGWLFFLEFIQTAGFLTLVLALNEMVRDNLMPTGLRWFLTLSAVAALVGAVGIGHFAKDRFTAEDLPTRKKDGPQPKT